MELIQHTLNWLKGEILEAKIMAAFGVLIVLSALLFWRYGYTPGAKAMVVPLLVVGCIPLLFGVFSSISYKKNAQQYEAAWEESKEDFAISERQRVEGFDNIFKYSYPFAFICVIGGAILFFIVNSPNWKAISLSMMLLGLMAYFVDYFAAERADIYYRHIMSSLSIDYDLKCGLKLPK